MSEGIFDAGTNYAIRPAWRRKATPTYSGVRIAAPGRLHMNVFDFSRMGIVYPGGGGIGFSTATGRNEVHLSVDHSGSAAPPSTPTARHLLKLFKELVGYKPNDIEVGIEKRITEAHVGYGSNVTHNTAVLWGLNVLFGTPFSVSELFEILTLNYVEIAKDGEHIYWGMDTGVGEAALLHGGVVWVDPDVKYVGRCDAGNMHVITAHGDPKRLRIDSAAIEDGSSDDTQMSGRKEEQLVAQKCLKYQQKYGATLLSFLERSLKPAFLSNDLSRFWDLGWKLNEFGTFKMLQVVYDPDILLCMEKEAREMGLSYFGLSSAGPSVFGVATDLQTCERALPVLEARFPEVFHGFRIARAGESITTRIDP